MTGILGLLDPDGTDPELVMRAAQSAAHRGRPEIITNGVVAFGALVRDGARDRAVVNKTNVSIFVADARIDRLTAARGLAAVVVAVVYGISDEWHQHFVPGRTSDVLDLLADAVGASLSVVLLWACGIIRRISPVRRV